jgi:hypothetical protein
MSRKFSVPVGRSPKGGLMARPPSSQQVRSRWAHRTWLLPAACTLAFDVCTLHVSEAGAKEQTLGAVHGSMRAPLAQAPLPMPMALACAALMPS